MEKENAGDGVNSSSGIRRTSARLSLSKIQPNTKPTQSITTTTNKSAISTNNNTRITTTSRFNNRAAPLARTAATTTPRSTLGRPRSTTTTTTASRSVMGRSRTTTPASGSIMGRPRTTTTTTAVAPNPRLGASRPRTATATTTTTTTSTAASNLTNRPLSTASRRPTTTMATKRPVSTTTFGTRNASTTTTHVGKRTTAAPNSRVASEPGKRASWDIRGKYSDLLKQYDDLQKDHENQLNELKKEKELVEEQSLMSQSKATQLEVELGDAKSAITTLQVEIDNFPQKLAEKEQQINSLLEQISNQKVINADLTNTVEQLTTSRDNFQTKYNQLRFEHTNVTANCQLLENELSIKDEQLKQATHRIESLENLLTESKKQLGKQDMDRRYLHHKIMELKGTVRVACRVRPVLSSEQQSTVYSIEYNSSDSSMKIVSTQSRDSVSGEKVDSLPYSFKFDNFFGAHSSQKNVFDEIEPLIQSALDGYNVCIFAYGQTGSGKTFTMEGDTEHTDKHGMIPRAVNKIFESMPPMERNGWSYKVYVSFIEIYNENLRDLLGSMDEKTGAPKNELKIYQPSSAASLSTNNINDVEITNLKVVQVHNPQEVHELLRVAHKNRTVGATKCNINSSRSHSVFQLKLVGNNDLLKETSVGKVNLVDLAGSERLKESQAEGIRLVETRHINKSLSTLRKVMQSLSDKDTHVPFRDSKLTHLLQTSLGGNSKSLMFVNISPLEEHFNESVNSLRFAAKVNEVQIGVATQNKKKLAY